MPFSQDMFYRIATSIGEVQAEIRALGAASIERNKGIHRRLDRSEDQVRSEIRFLRDEITDIREKQVAPSKLSLWKALGRLAAHWQILVMGLLMILGALGVLKPDTIKALKSFIKGLGE